MNTNKITGEGFAGNTAAFSRRYFVSLNEDFYINGMMIAFSEEDAANYISQKLPELSEPEFESVGPDCQLIDGQVVKGPSVMPELSTEAKQAILSAWLRDASEKIQILQDAIDQGMATESEKKSLSEWRTYRVLLSRVDVSASPETSWPDKPAS